MKLFYLTLLAIIVFSSCQNNAETNEPSSSSDEIEIVQKDILSSTLQPILLSSGEVIRNIDFSMNKTQIESTEEIDATESTDTETLYSIDLSDTDFADIMYSYAGDGSLTKIQVDIFTETKTATSEYLTAFETYFNEKYLKVDNLWDGVDYTVFLKEFSNNDNGLYVVWEKN